MKQDYYCKEREVFTIAFVKKTWKDRIAEFPTRRRLTKEDNTSELVTVAREEGTLSQEGDAFSAENMNDLENRIDAEFTELNGKLGKYKLSTCGFFSINLVVGSNMVSADKLLSGSLPQTKHTLFTVTSQGTTINRLIDIFFDGGNNLVAYTNVAQRYSVMWVSFEMA